jgi:hypothetical protein
LRGLRPGPQRGLQLGRSNQPQGPPGPRSSIPGQKSGLYNFSSPQTVTRGINPGATLGGVNPKFRPKRIGTLGNRIGLSGGQINVTGNRLSSPGGKIDLGAVRLRLF